MLSVFLTLAIATIIVLVVYILVLKGYGGRFVPKFLQNKDSPNQDGSHQKKPITFTDITKQPSPVKRASSDDGGFNTSPHRHVNHIHDNAHLPAPPVVPPPRFPPTDSTSEYCKERKLRLHENPANDNDEYSAVYKDPTYNNMTVSPLQLSKSGRLPTATNV